MENEEDLEDPSQASDAHTHSQSHHHPHHHHHSQHKHKHMTKQHKERKMSNASASSSPIQDRLRGDGPLPQPLNPLVDSRNLRSKMLATDEDGEEDEYAVKFQDRYGSSVFPERERSSMDRTATSTKERIALSPRKRSRSVTEQVRMLIRSKDDSQRYSGILLPSRNSPGNSSTISRSVSNNGVTIVDNPPIGRVTSSASSRLSKNSRGSRFSAHSEGSHRRDSMDSDDSDVDSHGSRDSQETEEDVCFPMVPKHIRVRGIDFDEVEEFITEQRLENEEILKREIGLRSQASGVSTSSEKLSTAALKYTPRLKKRGRTEQPPATESIDEHTSSNEKLSDEGASNSLSFHEIMSNSSKLSTTTSESHPDSDGVPDRFSFFNSACEETIHAPDIPSLVVPGKSVRSLFEPQDSIWWLDCICPTDDEMKMLAKAFGIHPLTAEDIRMQEAREKVELFRSYYFVCFHTFETDSESEDFLEPINVYLVVFRQGMLTFHFAPITNPANVRRRVRQLRDYVDVSADWLCYAMIDDITDGFAPVIHTIEYEADAIEDSVFLSRSNDFRAMIFRIGESRRKVMTLMRLLQGKADVIKMFAKRCHEDKGPLAAQSAQPRADIALYLGDIQDHIITMFQSLLSYEKIFTRSHSNYLAQLQVESFYSNNQVTDMLSKVTMIGTILVPMNLVTGLFGMNVRVPGKDGSNYGWFGGILGFIIVMIVVCGLAANWYMDRAQRRDSGLGGNSPGMSIRTFGFGRRTKEAQRDHTNRSMVSLPSRFTRYGDWS
ncbi:hypothetical protein FOA43_004753 [Brettanomyces nanus]|uniref:Uncharacterized protein n=1 Tax=Eeniella nana TaxID=13502 RepID=A0A875SFI3_EENNA|nr:uncharacterized protein FOA43_004753 [Brettanomyces nanus]QPG77344.1 hypothetical protein FOA43_004753 [Brettanomyces nanus]